jgi:hypothetical protein
MEQCGIEITSNDPALLSYLAKHPEKSSWFVIEVKEVYYLIAPDFQGLATSEEVRQAANDLIFILNGIMKLKFKHAHLIRGTTVGYFDNGGQLIRAAVSKDIATRFHLSGGEPFFQDADAKIPSSMDIWMKARNDALVEEALQHYANEHNWFNLYKVFEIIEHNVDKSTFGKWTQSKADDFTYSANNARASGHTARHSSTKFQKASAKRTPMPLAQAHEFITDLLLQWLCTKAS